MKKKSQKTISISRNLRALVTEAPDNPNAAVIQVNARVKAARVAFEIHVSSGFVSYYWQLPGLRGGNWLTIAEDISHTSYGLWVDQSFFSSPLIMGMEFEPGTSPVENILSITHWDGEGGTPRLVYVECGL